jgi:hypothetical protein
MQDFNSSEHYSIGKVYPNKLVVPVSISYLIYVEIVPVLYKKKEKIIGFTYNMLFINVSFQSR